MADDLSAWSLGTWVKPKGSKSLLNKFDVMAGLTKVLVPLSTEVVVLGAGPGGFINLDASEFGFKSLKQEVM